MKKLIVPICLLFIFSCKEKEDTDDYVANGIVPLNETNLTGSWDVVKVNYYALPNDSLVDSKVYPKEAVVLAFPNGCYCRKPARLFQRVFTETKIKRACCKKHIKGFHGRQVRDNVVPQLTYLF